MTIDNATIIVGTKTKRGGEDGEPGTAREWTADCRAGSNEKQCRTRSSETTRYVRVGGRVYILLFAKSTVSNYTFFSFFLFSSPHGHVGNCVTAQRSLKIEPLCCVHARAVATACKILEEGEKKKKKTFAQRLKFRPMCSEDSMSPNLRTHSCAGRLLKAKLRV